MFNYNYSIPLQLPFSKFLWTVMIQWLKPLCFTPTSFFLWCTDSRRWINSSRKWEVCRELSHTQRVLFPLSIRPSTEQMPHSCSPMDLSTCIHPAAGEKLSIHRCGCSQDPFCSCDLQSWWKHSFGVVAATARAVHGTDSIVGILIMACFKGRRWFSWDCVHWLAGNWSCKIGFGLYPHSKKSLDTFVALSVFPWLSGVCGTWWSQGWDKTRGTSGKQGWKRVCQSRVPVPGLITLLQCVAGQAAVLSGSSHRECCRTQTAGSAGMCVCRWITAVTAQERTWQLQRHHSHQAFFFA